MSYVDTSIEGATWETLNRKRNAMSSRLMLLRLQRHHYEHAPASFKDLHLPVLYMDVEIPRTPIFEEVEIELTGIPPAQPLHLVLAEVAREYKIPEWRILGNQRTKEVVGPRHMAMFLAIEFSPLPIAQIAKFFKRDHTVVLHARKTVSQKMESDQYLARRVKSLKWKIMGNCKPNEVEAIATMRDQASKKFGAKFNRMEAAQ